MIDFLKYLRIFSDLFTNFTFPQWEKKILETLIGNGIQVQRSLYL